MMMSIGGAKIKATTGRQSQNLYQFGVSIMSSLACFDSSDFIRKEEDGIEYYTHSDSGESGMSIRGVAKMLGIDHKAVLYWVNKLESGIPGNTEAHFSLKPFIGKHLRWGNKPGLNHVLVSHFCSALTFYYATDADNPTDEAKKALYYFNLKGVERFIQEKTGWVKPQGQQKSLLEPTESKLIPEVLQMVQELKAIDPKVDALKAYLAFKEEYKAEQAELNKPPESKVYSPEWFAVKLKNLYESSNKRPLTVGDMLGSISALKKSKTRNSWTADDVRKKLAEVIEAGYGVWIQEGRTQKYVPIEYKNRHYIPDPQPSLLM